MDSWTPVQLTIMKAGGNDSCNNYLWKKGVPKTASIKEKYESDAAALYKLVIKARAEGNPEPTVLPPSTKNTTRPPYVSTRTAPTGNGAAKASIGGGGGGGGAAKGGSQDANGLERLAGESDAQYISRQTRLREEAKARMAAKFGGNGKRTMGGVGSSPYPSSSSNGHRGSGAGAGGLDMNSLTESFSSGFGSAASGLSSAFSFAKESVNSVEAKSVANDMKDMGLGLWSAFSSGAKEVASGLNVNLDMDGDGDGLSALQEKVRRERSARGSNSVYSGFGSDTASTTASNSNITSSHGGMNNNSMPVPIAVDRNSKSAAPLPGESDADYMQRQIRIREEATSTITASAPRTPGKPAVTKMKVDELDEDFFASFGA
jgi:hypothetical protein